MSSDPTFFVVQTTPLSDTSGEIIFNSNFPYDNITAKVISPAVGSTANIPLEYDFQGYPPGNLDKGVTFTGLVPNSENIVEYLGNTGITLANFLITTDNIKYPILITDDYSRWATPPSDVNSNSIYNAYGTYTDKKNKEFVVFGEGGQNIAKDGSTAIQTYSNFITSTDGLVWSNMTYNNPFLNKIKSYSVDKSADIGVAIGEGSDYSISILAGTTANGQIWLPIEGSKQLISNPKGIIRGSSWIVWGDKGSSGSFSIVESRDGLVWTGVTGMENPIMSADINQFNGKVIAAIVSPARRLIQRDPITYQWSQINTPSASPSAWPNQIFRSMTHVAVGSQYGQLGSPGRWLLTTRNTNTNAFEIYTSADDGSLWTLSNNLSVELSTIINALWQDMFIATDSDSTYQDWQFFAKDSNGELNIIEVSVTGTTGRLQPFNYGVVKLEGLTGLYVNGYSSINSKPLDGITYQSFDFSGTYENLSAVKSVTGQSLPGLTGVVDVQSGDNYYVGTTFANNIGSTALSSFSFEFKCDKFTSKSVNFTDELGLSGYYYNFVINDYKNDVGTTGGYIYEFQTNSHLQGGTSFYKINVVNNGLVYAENIIFGDMYQSQLTELNKILIETKKIIDFSESIEGVEKELFNGKYDYEGISGSEELTTFYNPVSNRRQNNIGTFNFDSFTNLENLVGYPINSNLLNLEDLYSQISDPLKARDFKEILEKMRLLEYYLSYDETIVNTIRTEFPEFSEKQGLLNSLFNVISTSLNTRTQSALGNLNVATSLFNSFTREELTYDENTLFKFTFDGTNLNFYKDSELLQTFTIFNKKKLNISLNISPNIRTTSETIDGLNVGIRNTILKKNSNSQLKEAIETNFEFKTSENNYVSKMKYIGLIPDTNKNDSELASILPNISASYPDAPPSVKLLNFSYKIDQQIIRKNYYYTLSKFVTDSQLLRRVGKLMSQNISTSPTFNYYDIYDIGQNSIPSLSTSMSGLQIYQKLFGKDFNTGFYFINYLVGIVYKNINEAFVTRLRAYLGSGVGQQNGYMLYNSRFRQMGIETFRNRFVQEDNVLYSSVGSSQDYKNMLELIKSEYWNFAYYYNLGDGAAYSNLQQNPQNVEGPFNRLPDRRFVFDFMYKDLDANINYSYGLTNWGHTGPTGLQTRTGILVLNTLNNTPGNSILYNQFNNEFKCTTGNIQLLLSDSVTGTTSGVSLMSFLNKASQIANVLGGLTANNQNLSYSISKSIYPSFFSEVLDTAGVTLIESTMLEQNRSEYNLLKKYLDKIIYGSSTDGTLDTSFLRPSYNEGISGVPGIEYAANQFLSLMNDARMYGCSAISDINVYNTLLAGYTGIKFTPLVTTTQVYNSLIGDYNTTFVPLIKTLLLNKLELDPTNTEYYYSDDQHRLFKTYLKSGGETSGYYYNMLKYNPDVPFDQPVFKAETFYININEIYTIFAQETLGQLKDKVDTVFSGSNNIDDDLALVQSIVAGTEPILKSYILTKRRLDNQANFYIDQIGNFNSYILKYDLLNGISGGYARFNQMIENIGLTAPPEPEENTLNYQNFIVNIPPFDDVYWRQLTSTLNMYSFPAYNPNYRYYLGDIVTFDNYGTTGMELYGCISTTRYGSIKGTSPGSLGIEGSLSSLLCWEEYHDINFPIDLNNPPLPRSSKYDEFSFNEKNYSLVGVTGQEEFFTTQVYSDEVEYLKGSIVIYNNAPFVCLGSEELFTGVGQGIPPGFNDDYDIYWKVIGAAGENLYEYPQSNGVWKLEPELNQEFIDFTTLYGLTATFTTKNAQNLFIAPNDYDQNFEYNFGDLVVSIDNKIYTCLGNKIVGINPPTLNSVRGNAIWKAYPYLDTTGIPEFSITRSYNLGEVVKYKNIAYKFYFDNENVPNFGVGNGITYGYLDKVEYGGYIFASKINDNIAEPLIPVNIGGTGATAGTYTKQDLIDSKYWSYLSGVSGYAGTLPPRYNFKHDYAYDYNVLKKSAPKVTFADAIWEWTYNPLNINYQSLGQQRYSNLSTLKNIQPPPPEPLRPWNRIRQEINNKFDIDTYKQKYCFVHGLSGTTLISSTTVSPTETAVDDWIFCYTEGATLQSDSILDGLTYSRRYEMGELVFNGGTTLNPEIWGFVERFETFGLTMGNIDPGSSWMQLKVNNNILTKNNLSSVTGYTSGTYNLGNMVYIDNFKGVYNNNETYSGGDIVEYYSDFKGTTLYFEATGEGYGTCVINENGDTSQILPYDEDTTMTFGALAQNRYGRYPLSVVAPGNATSNYTGIVPEVGLIDYGYPKWGSGILHDRWHMPGFATNIRKSFADTVEITYNKLINDLELLQYFPIENQGDNIFYFSLNETSSYPKQSVNLLEGATANSNNNWLVCKVDGVTANYDSIIPKVVPFKTVDEKGVYDPTSERNYQPGDLIINPHDSEDRNSIWAFIQPFSNSLVIPGNTAANLINAENFKNSVIKLKVDDQPTFNENLAFMPEYIINKKYNKGNIVYNKENLQTNLSGPLTNLIQSKYIIDTTPTQLINRIKSDLGSSQMTIGRPKDIYRINNVLLSDNTPTTLFKELETKFTETQFYYYSGLVKYTQKFEKTLKMLNTYLNDVKNLWYNINLPYIKEIYETYYLLDRYYPSKDGGPPLMSKDFELNPIQTLGQVYIRPDVNSPLQNMKNFTKIINDNGKSDTINLLFTRNITSFENYGFTGFKPYSNFGIDASGSYPCILKRYDGNTLTIFDNTSISQNQFSYFNKDTGVDQGPTASNNAWFLNKDYFIGGPTGYTGGLVDLQRLSPVFCMIYSQYDTIIADIAFYRNRLNSLVGLDLLKEMSNAQYMNLSGGLNNTMYEKGCAIYTGTDIPIFTPIITSNDLDMLSLSFGTKNSNTLWFDMPGGIMGMPSANLGTFEKSNNYGLIEPFKVDIFPNMYQFKDTKYAFETICESTFEDIRNPILIEPKMRRNIITKRLSLENRNYIPNRGAWFNAQLIGDKKRIGFYNGSVGGIVFSYDIDNQSSHYTTNGLTGFADETDFILYQPYGAIYDGYKSAGRDTPAHTIADNYEDDKVNDNPQLGPRGGYNSVTASRRHLGDRYDDEQPSNDNLPPYSNVYPMGYYTYGTGTPASHNLAFPNRAYYPPLLAITESELFTHQGKCDISNNLRFRSVLPYVFYMNQLADVEPDYTRVTSNVLRDIKIEERRQESENRRRQTQRIATVIFLAITIVALSVITLVSSIFGPGVLVPIFQAWSGTVLAFATTVTAITATLGLAGTILKESGYNERNGRILSSLFSDPVGLFRNPPITPVGLQNRCIMLENLLDKLHTEDRNDDDPILDTVRISYHEYIYAKEKSNYLISHGIQDILADMDVYYIDGVQDNIESLYRCGEITETEKTQSYLQRSPGTTGYTSLNDYIYDYDDDIVGKRHGNPVRIPQRRYTEKDYLEASQILFHCNKIIALYETSLNNPRFVRSDFNEGYQRPATIGITDIQYGNSIIDPNFPESYSGSTAYSPDKQLYARFKIIDAGEGFYKTEEFTGNIIPISKVFDNLDINLNNRVTGVTLSFNFMNITSGYCNEGTTLNSSIFGIKKFDTSEMKDNLKLPFTYSDPQNAYRDLKGVTFLITHSLMGLTSVGYAGIQDGAEFLANMSEVTGDIGDFNEAKKVLETHINSLGRFSNNFILLRKEPPLVISQLDIGDDDKLIDKARRGAHPINSKLINPNRWGMHRFYTALWKMTLVPYFFDYFLNVSDEKPFLPVKKSFLTSVVGFGVTEEGAVLSRTYRQTLGLKLFPTNTIQEYAMFNNRLYQISYIDTYKYEGAGYYFARRIEIVKEADLKNPVNQAARRVYNSYMESGSVPKNAMKRIAYATRPGFPVPWYITFNALDAAQDVVKPLEYKVDPPVIKEYIEPPITKSKISQSSRALFPPIVRKTQIERLTRPPSFEPSIQPRRQGGEGGGAVRDLITKFNGGVRSTQDKPPTAEVGKGRPSAVERLNIRMFTGLMSSKRLISNPLISGPPTIIDAFDDLGKSPYPRPLPPWKIKGSSRFKIGPPIFNSPQTKLTIKLDPAPAPSGPKPPPPPGPDPPKEPDSIIGSKRSLGDLAKTGIAEKKDQTLLMRGWPTVSKLLSVVGIVTSLIGAVSTVFEELEEPPVKTTC